MFCESCGKDVHPQAMVCIHCGCSLSRGKREDRTAMRILFPVDRSVFAIISGWAALLAILMFLFPVTAPFAIVFGILGIVDIRKNRDKLGMGRCIFGIVAGSVFSVILGIMVYVWFFLPLP